MSKNAIIESVSILMPTYKQASFILCALKSVIAQTFKNWELIIINDGSPDDTDAIIREYLNHSQIFYLKNDENKGLGFCLNLGLRAAKNNYIAYLPSDDVWYEKHLEVLVKQLSSNSNCVLAYCSMHSGYNYHAQVNNWAETVKFGFGRGIQLVQVMHKKVDAFWLERNELVTDNQFVLFWKKLLDRGLFMSTGEVTCQYGNHMYQRHKIINRNMGGGLAAYRSYYKVQVPIKFISSAGDNFDEPAYYPQLKRRKSIRKGLKILLVGELAYNAERICALEEYGHQLFGLWINKPSIFNTVGPLPYGNIQDLSYENWQKEIAQIQPDIIYALLNEPSISLAHEILVADTGIPFVWHFKEGPFTARSMGLWEKLVELYTKADGIVYINDLYQKWMNQFLSGRRELSLILDGDLVKKEWMTFKFSEKLSIQDGEIHTLIIGRPLGITPDDVLVLANNNIHIHLYGTYDVIFKDWIEKNKSIANKYFHVHSNCHPHQWVEEFSKYDAAWLHSFESKNGGDLKRLTWHDLNLPARMSTLAVSGLPMIQRCNKEHLVATQQVLENYDMGVLYKDIDELINILKNPKRMQGLNKNARLAAKEFCFDNKVPELTSFFEEVIRVS